LLFTNRALAAPIYPVSARLTLAPREQQRCLSVSEEPDCRILDMTREAFAGTVLRMFKSGVAADLVLVLQVRDAEIFNIAGKLELSTRVRVLTPGGEAIDEIDAFGTAPVLALETGPITYAERAAAEDAARSFERSYANSSKIGDYLVQNKVAPASAVAVYERSDQLFTLGVGIGFVQGGGDDLVAVAPSLHIAGSYRSFFVQATYSRYTSSFQRVAGGRVAPGDLTTNDLGLEGGPVLRFTRNIELRGGPGIHYLVGDGTTDSGSSSSFDKVAPTLYASISSSFIPFRNSPRWVIALDWRAYFFATVGLPDLLRKVPAANTSLALSLGIELPWGARKGSAQ